MSIATTPSPDSLGESLQSAAAAPAISELKKACEEAERTSREKSRFLATASHDLRQPLQMLSLLNGAMRRLAGDGELAEALSQQEQAIDSMSRLINALLDISKLESGAVRPALIDFSVAELFRELRGEFAPPAVRKGLQLRVDVCCSHSVTSDPSLVEQILRNLLSNAIKYTREGEVLLSCLHDQGYVRLEVRDTGAGMSAEALPHIFDEFYQIGISANTSRDGYGLGLSIVRRIVDLLGLELEVSSEPGHGSIFSLRLPTSEKTEAHLRQQRPQAPARTSHAPRVLLVEDDAGVRNATGMLLRAAGYDVSTASSLSEALQQATHPPGIELLITDYHLENEETGVQVIAAVRARSANDLKAVLVTGDTSPAIHGLEGDEHLRIARKPVNAEEFLRLLGELTAR